MIRKAENKAAKTNDSKQEWLMLVYEQAWAQYTHEDEMAEQRDTKYLTIISLFLSAIGIVCSMLFTHLTSDSRNDTLTICILAVIAILLLMVILFASNWLHVTKTAEKYVAARLKTLETIESKINDPIKMSKIDLDSSEKDGFATTLNLVWIILIVAAILLAAAVASILLLIVI